VNQLQLLGGHGQAINQKQEHETRSRPIGSFSLPYFFIQSAIIYKLIHQDYLDLPAVNLSVNLSIKELILKKQAFMIY
jgi:hypothetical protein